jgi:hypothetical protein
MELAIGQQWVYRPEMIRAFAENLREILQRRSSAAFLGNAKRRIGA